MCGSGRGASPRVADAQRNELFDLQYLHSSVLSSSICGLDRWSVVPAAAPAPTPTNQWLCVGENKRRRFPFKNSLRHVIGQFNTVHEGEEHFRTISRHKRSEGEKRKEGFYDNITFCQWCITRSRFWHNQDHRPPCFLLLPCSCFSDGVFLLRCASPYHRLDALNQKTK